MIRALIVSLESGDARRALRTERSLAKIGIPFREVRSQQELHDALANSTDRIWLIQAGAWPIVWEPWQAIPPSATGKPLIGLETKFNGRQVRSCYLESESARELARRLSGENSWQKAVRHLARDRRFRAVPLPAIDVSYDRSLRVVQVVTSIQIGGAERVTLDLSEELNRTGQSTFVAALGRPARRAFPAPKRFADLSHIDFAPESRAEAIERICLDWGADLVHAHLVSADEAFAIRRRDLPLLVSVHNESRCWPPGYEEAREPFADRLLACSLAVSQDVAKHLPQTPSRTVWNGIESSRIAPSSQLEAAAGALRRELGWSANDLVIVAVANPRRQKRLDRLPEIVARLDEVVAPRRVRLLLAGEPSCAGQDGREAVARLEEELDRWALSKAIHWTGAIDDVSVVLATADVFVSTSEVEGLSLAQLEAIAAGLPVVATDVGGAREVAGRLAEARIVLLPRQASAESFVKALAALATSPLPRRDALPRDFTRSVMAEQTRLHYWGTLVAKQAERAGEKTLWLITNNFATGGAQTSARRLLCGLRERGVTVRAATLEEWPDRPTVGCEAARESGIPVSLIRPSHHARQLVEDLLTEMTDAPPLAVVFWNVIAPVKMMLADVLTGLAIYDVSPGEMFFRSLERAFAAPIPGLPLISPHDYGARLTGVIVKYAGERPLAEKRFGSETHVIPNGVPLVPPARGSSGKKFRIGTTARISPDKRLEDLLAALREAAPSLPRCEVHIAGGVESGSERYAEDLRRSARGLPIRWLGHVADIPRFLAGLDLFVMISEPAGCPNALLEAMSAGLPIIATDHGGAGELVVDGATGCLTPRGDAKALAKAMLDLAHDSATRARWATAARERVETHYSMERMIDRYAAVFLDSGR
jgi:glycosyltransferase involved in cell wall biosynthesis